MSKRLLGSVLTALALGILIFVLPVAFAGAPSRAGSAGPVETWALAAKAPARQQIDQTEGTWVEIAPFPTVGVGYCSGIFCIPTPTYVPMKLKRAGAAAYLATGKLYVLGGRHGVDGGDDFALQNIWEYTPGNPGSWARKNALLDQPTGTVTATPVPYGERYTANMAVAVLLGTNGPRIYAIGGSSTNSVPSTAVRVYDPVLDQVTDLESDPWPGGTHNPGGWATYNNKLYIFGGFSALGNGAVFSDTWRFDPLAADGSKWTRMSQADLGMPRGYIAGAALDGKIYAIGGDTWVPPVSTTPGRLAPVARVEMMDPTQPNPTWTAVASLPTARGDMGAWAYNSGTGYQISGKIAVSGGHYDIPDAQGYLYNPVSNSWGPFTGMAHPTRNYAYAQMDGYLYAFGGYDYSNNTPSGANFSQRYDATGGTGGTPTPTATCPPAASTVDVNIQDFEFLPKNITITVGSTVRWTNLGSSLHTTTSDTGLWDSHDLSQNQQFSYTFDTPNTYSYHCSRHPDLMTGSIVVLAACGGSTTATQTRTPSTTRTVTRTVTATAEATATICPLQFEDVLPTGPSSTFYPYVRCLACKGIISGYQCGGTGEPCNANNDPYFRPNNPVSRGQIAKIVAQSAGFTEPIPPTQQTFEDVVPGTPFHPYVERLASRGIVGGYECGIAPNEPCIPPNNRKYYRPDGQASRGQLAKIVSEAGGFHNTIPSNQYTFTDVMPGSTFWIYIERLLSNRPNVMSGYPCGGPGEPCDAQNRHYFRWGNPVTRGQASKIDVGTFFPGCNPAFAR